MAYLKSASPGWQARSGFSGLGAMRRRRRLSGQGNPLVWANLAATVNKPFVTGSPATGIPPGLVHAIGPIFAGPSRYLNPPGPLNPVTTPPSSTTNTGAGSTAANVSGSPVPVGYPTSQIYVEPGGAFWEFNGTSWQNVGTPYNVSGGSTPASTTSSTTAPASPVPAGYPTNLLYTYSDGSMWQYNAALGGWQEIQGPSSTTTQLSTTGAPAGTTVLPAVANSGYQSILDWLSNSTLISGVPNWIIAAGASLAAIKLMHPSGRR